MYESSALISAMLRVMHPALYSAGRQMMQCLASNDSLRSAISQWSSVFNACTLLSNRWTPNHRDNYSRAQWYDILTTFGAYRGAFLNLSSIGLKLQYSSGTVVGSSGKILQHGVPECEGERMCLAYYMRDKVHERMGVEAAPWMKMDYYQ